jgi:uncharacterized protein (DUF1697 family)
MGLALKTQYVALLRGINVGGKNIIRMVDLKTCFEKMGFTDVATYIQSGNVLFKSDEDNKIKLISKIEKELSKSFNYASVIVLVNYEQLAALIKEVPTGFGEQPDEYKYDVFFLKEPFKADEAIKSIKVREGVDNIYPGKDAIYSSRLISKAGQSYLSKIISLPVYKFMTIRNWNTTSRLFELMKNVIDRR